MCAPLIGPRRPSPNVVFFPQWMTFFSFLSGHTMLQIAGGACGGDMTMAFAIHGENEQVRRSTHPPFCKNLFCMPHYSPHASKVCHLRQRDEQASLHRWGKRLEPSSA